MIYAYSPKNICHIDRMVIPWKSGSSPLVSLLDMIQIYVEKFGTLISELNQLIHDLYHDERSELPQNEHERIGALIDRATALCELVELDAALRLIKQINEEKSYHWWLFGPAPRELGAIIEKLKDIIKDELREHLFMYIPLDKAQWYEKKDRFGKPVSDSFPLAIEDIKEAGTCYATGRYTASVFHAMRVLEHGLEALAHELGLTFYRQNWGTIIGKIQGKIDNEIENLKKLSKDPPRTTRLKFLSQAVKEFGYFKDGWRNYVMHGEDTYDGPEALRVLNHVKTFMAHLAENLKK